MAANIKIEKIVKNSKMKETVQKQEVPKTSFGDLIIIVKKKRRIAIHHPTTVGVM
jgi:hypothetical protein